MKYRRQKEVAMKYREHRFHQSILADSPESILNDPGEPAKLLASTDAIL